MLQPNKHNTLSQGGGASEYSPLAVGANLGLDVFVKNFRFLQKFWVRKRRNYILDSGYLCGLSVRRNHHCENLFRREGRHCERERSNPAN